MWQHLMYYIKLGENIITLWRLQYSRSVQWDSLRGHTCCTSSRYLMEEQEEVSTKCFTVAFTQELSTFKVPFIQGSIKFCCNIIQIIRDFSIVVLIIKKNCASLRYAIWYLVVIYKDNKLYAMSKQRRLLNNFSLLINPSHSYSGVTEFGFSKDYIPAQFVSTLLYNIMLIAHFMC